jgi:hypothetical protein
VPIQNNRQTIQLRPVTYRAKCDISRIYSITYKQVASSAPIRNASPCACFGSGSHQHGETLQDIGCHDECEVNGKVTLLQSRLSRRLFVAVFQAKTPPRSKSFRIPEECISRQMTWSGTSSRNATRKWAAKLGSQGFARKLDTVHIAVGGEAMFANTTFESLHFSFVSEQGGLASCARW